MVLGVIELVMVWVERRELGLVLSLGHFNVSALLAQDVELVNEFPMLHRVVDVDVDGKYLLAMFASPDYLLEGLFALFPRV